MNSMEISQKVQWQHLCLGDNQQLSNWTWTVHRRDSMPAKQTVNLVNYPELVRWQTLDTTIPSFILSIYRHSVAPNPLPRKLCAVDGDNHRRLLLSNAYYWLCGTWLQMISLQHNHYTLSSGHLGRGAGHLLWDSLLYMTRKLHPHNLNNVVA